MSVSLCEEHLTSNHSYSYFEAKTWQGKVHLVQSFLKKRETTPAPTPLVTYACFAALTEPTDYLNQKALEGLRASEIITRATKDIDSSNNTTIQSTTALQKPNSLNQKAPDRLEGKRDNHVCYQEGY
uniref:Uncharacterized protein n=1 Tax=Solanum lycopersicum TaxID=4081 RepID=K4B181_SOLLC